MSLFFLFLGYLVGSLPFSIWITRYVKHVDVRDSGSGHATTTNTIRQAGFGWGALVLVLDIAKGFIPTYLAVSQDGIPAYIIVLTAAFAVIGHCWPLFAQFRGGMGLATAGGSFLAVNPLTFLISLGLLILLVLVYFGYQTVISIPHLAAKSRTDRLQDTLFGAFLGALNGYLVAGTILYYMFVADYPFETVISKPTDPGILTTVNQMMQYMPPTLLGEPGIYFAIILAFVFVLVVYI